MNKRENIKLKAAHKRNYKKEFIDNEKRCRKIFNDCFPYSIGYPNKGRWRQWYKCYEIYRVWDIEV